MRWLLACLVFLVATVAGRAAGWGEEPPATIDVSLLSEHVVRGVERAGAAARVEIAGGVGGWRARLAGIVPVARAESSEWLVAGAWGREVGERLGLSAGVTWTSFATGAREPAHDFLEFHADAAWNLPREFVATVSAAHDVELDATTLEAALAHSFALARWGAYLDGRAFAGWSDGRDWRRHTGRRVRDAYGYWGIAAEIPYRVGGNASVVVGAEYSALWNHEAAGSLGGPKGRRNLTGRVGVRFDF